jgi:hypothetical protein
MFITEIHARKNSRSSREERDELGKQVSEFWKMVIDSPLVSTVFPFVAEGVPLANLSRAPTWQCADTQERLCVR